MKISVCMALYNGEQYLQEQLESLLKQLSSNDEVIISDDGSTDRSFQIITGFNDDRIKVVKNPKNRSYTNNYENALSIATGDYIFLADQDDVWYANKVEKVMRELEKCDFVIHDCKITNANLEVMHNSFFDKYNVKFGFANQLFRMRYLGCCMAFNKKILNKVLPFPTNKSLYEHDSWIATVAELYGKCTVIREPLMYYRRHGNNTSAGGKNTGKKKILILIHRRLYRGFEALRRIYK